MGDPIQKTTNPITEDDLRIIALIPLLSKGMERFVMTWLMFYAPIALLACAIDFSKSFNKVNDNICITKLSTWVPQGGS